MKCVVQRVLEASCVVDNQVISTINQGLVVFTCFEKGDSQQEIEKCVYKVLNLRIFDDLDGKMNLSIKDIQGGILHISQFTLSWSGEKGHRPSFEKSMPAREANLKYELLTREFQKEINCSKGVFGGDMKISLINDGPVTFHLEF